MAGSVEYEYRIVRPGGEIRVVNHRAEAIRDATGRPTGLIGTVHDITELKATEGRLRASEERYKLAAQGAEVGLFDWDVPTGATYFSPRALRDPRGRCRRRSARRSPGCSTVSCRRIARRCSSTS